MKKKQFWYIAWVAGFIICAALGFIREPQGALKGFLVALAVIHFVPPCVLLVRGDRQDHKRILWLSFLWLGLTLLLLVFNIGSFAASEVVGETLYGILILVSSPMVCGQYWIISLFLWACLMTGALSKLRKRK